MKKLPPAKTRSPTPPSAAPAVVKGASILITGGTGSFGRALTRRLLALTGGPRRIVILSRDEFKQFEMGREIGDEPRLRFFLGDVRDRDRLNRAFQGVDIVVHAAALKHVTAGEYNPFEVLRTNTFGAQNVIEASIDAGVRRVMGLSTDKAANPINLYGASKLCADKLFIAGNAYVGTAETRLSVVRYGNVLGSRGSVLADFIAARDAGTELRITDKRMTRFWITVDQAVDFVLARLSDMAGGEVFVPKIPSSRLIDLARVVAPGARMVETGIRPGEKLHEVMVPADEARLTLDCGDHYAIEPAFAWWAAKPKRDGKRVAEGFEFRSDLNPELLAGAALAAFLKRCRVF